MTHYTTSEAARVTAPLSAMAARILVFLFLQEPGRSFTGKELMSLFGATKPTISAAIGNLEANGFVQNNGRSYGWSLLPQFHQMSLPFVDKPVDNFIGDGREGKKFFTQNAPKVKNSLPISPSYDDDLNSHEKDHHHSSSESAARSKFLYPTPDHSDIEERKALLRRFDVRGMALMRYSTPPCPETAVILALGWESLTQPLSNPGGWIHSQLRAGQEPGRDFLELARLWLELDADGRDALCDRLDAPLLDEYYTLGYLTDEFDLSREAAKLAVDLWSLGAFEEL